MRTQHQPSHGPWPPFSVVRTGPTFFFGCHAPCNALQPPAVRDGDGFLAWAQSCDHASRRHNVCRRNHAHHARLPGTDKLSLPDWLFRPCGRLVLVGRSGAGPVLQNPPKKNGDQSNKTSSSSRAAAASRPCLVPCRLNINFFSTESY